jgi:hypothetical protein
MLNNASEETAFLIVLGVLVTICLTLLGLINTGVIL